MCLPAPRLPWQGGHWLRCFASSRTAKPFTTLAINSTDSAFTLPAQTDPFPCSRLRVICMGFSSTNVAYFSSSPNCAFRWKAWLLCQSQFHSCAPGEENLLHFNRFRLIFQSLRILSTSPLHLLTDLILSSPPIHSLGGELQPSKLSCSHLSHGCAAFSAVLSNLIRLVILFTLDVWANHSLISADKGRFAWLPPSLPRTFIQEEAQRGAERQ